MFPSSLKGSMPQRLIPAWGEAKLRVPESRERAGCIIGSNPTPTSRAMLKNLLRPAYGRALKLRSALKKPALYVADYVGDLYDRTTGARKPLTPPRRSRRYVGGGDFHEVGQQFLGHLIELVDLKPQDRILDIGCGIGRIAVALTDYITPPGSYDGFDIVPLGVKWCEKNITPKFPNFRFQQADIYNKFYYPKGTQKSDSFQFPYPTGSFDAVVLTSVFTHMLPNDIDHYLSEISRVLDVGGRALMTFFVFDGFATNAIETKTAGIPFGSSHGNYRLRSEEYPELSIGFEESFIRELIEKNGLDLQEPIHFGSWSGRQPYTSFQDIVIVTKPS